MPKREAELPSTMVRDTSDKPFPPSAPTGSPQAAALAKLAATWYAAPTHPSGLPEACQNWTACPPTIPQRHRTDFDTLIRNTTRFRRTGHRHEVSSTQLHACLSLPGPASLRLLTLLCLLLAQPVEPSLTTTTGEEGTEMLLAFPPIEHGVHHPQVEHLHHVGRIGAPIVLLPGINWKLGIMVLMLCFSSSEATMMPTPSSSSSYSFSTIPGSTDTHAHRRSSGQDRPTPLRDWNAHMPFDNEFLAIPDASVRLLRGSTPVLQITEKQEKRSILRIDRVADVKEISRLQHNLFRWTRDALQTTDISSADDFRLLQGAGQPVEYLLHPGHIHHKFATA